MEKIPLFHTTYDIAKSQVWSERAITSVINMPEGKRSNGVLDLEIEKVMRLRNSAFWLPIHSTVAEKSVKVSLLWIGTKLVYHLLSENAEYE